MIRLIQPGSHSPLLLGVFFLFLFQVPEAYSMNKAKEWVNNVRPGTFEMPDASGDTKVEKKDPRKFSEAELKVLISLRAREAELKRREEAIQKKSQELKNLTLEFDRKLDQLRSVAR